MSLVAQLKKELVGGQIVGTEFYKKERAAYIFVKNGKDKHALGFVYHPTGHGVFCVPPSKIKIETKEKPWPIFVLDGATIMSIQFPHLDRIFLIELEREKQISRLVVEGLGPNGNIWHIGPEYEILGTLRKRHYTDGRPYEISSFADRIDPRQLTMEQLEQLLDDGDASTVRSVLEKKFTGFNKTLAREVLARADFTDGDSLDAATVQSIYEAVKSIVQLFAGQDVGYVYEIGGGLEVYPFKLRSRDNEPEKIKSLSLAILEQVSRKQTAIEERDEKSSSLTAVKKMIKKLAKRIENVALDIEKASEFEHYKKVAELLQINLKSVKRGMSEIELENIYIEPNRVIKIKLDPALSPADNAGEYFKKHRKGREGLELLQRRLEISKAELKQWQNIYSELEDNFEHASRRYQADIISVLPREVNKGAEAVRLPYREHQLSTGLTIFIGRDGSDNDRTTFEFAKPFEFWFHTQQCPGSHVVMKFPHKNFEPSKVEIEETAAIAAWHSKARNDSLVPVIYTQRKYVHKPRKAKPGLVTVEREKSIMIKPGSGSK